MNQESYKQAMEHLKTPANLDEKTIEFLQNRQPMDNIIIPKKRKRAFLRFKVIAAIAVVLTISAGAALNVYEFRFINFSGNISTTTDSFLNEWKSESDSKSEEEIAFEIEFYDYKDGEITLTIEKGQDISNCSPLLFTVTSLEELKEYINKDIFILPEYMPTGYEFTSAKIELYLIDSDLNNSELIFSEEKFGRLYEKYKITKINKHNIEGVQILYENDAGESFSYWVKLRENVKNINIGIMNGMETEKIVVPGYDLSFFNTYHEDDKDYTYSQINLLEEIDGTIPVNIIHPATLNKELQKKATLGKSNFISSRTVLYTGLHYIIDSHYLDRSELVKIAENLK